MEGYSSFVVLILCCVGICNAALQLEPPGDTDTSSVFLPTDSLLGHEPKATDEPSSRVKRGSAYPGGHGDFSGVAKQSTFAALGSYGGFLGHGGGSVAGGYGAGSGRNGLGAAGGITISGALGSYGGYLGHKGPVVLSSGGYGNGGLLFGKI